MRLRRENIKPIEQHLKMPAGYFRGTTTLRRLKPTECGTFQSLAPKGESCPVIIKHLQCVPAAVYENKQAAVEWRPPEIGLDQHGQGIYLLSTVYGFSAYIDMFESGKRPHLDKLPKTFPSQTGSVLSPHSNATPFGSSKRNVAAGTRFVFSGINNFSERLSVWRGCGAGRASVFAARNL